MSPHLAGELVRRDAPRLELGLQPGLGNDSFNWGNEIGSHTLIESAKLYF
jgi:hypothetical protein